MSLAPSWTSRYRRSCHYCYYIIIGAVMYYIIIGAVMEVQVQAIVLVGSCLWLSPFTCIRKLEGDHKRANAC